MRYRAAAGVGEEAHSRQPHWCPWSKLVNVETWGHVSGPIVMAHAFAELRYGIVAHQHERDFNYGHNFAHTLYGLGMLHVRYRARRNHGTLFEPLAARQRTPGVATDVLVMRIGAVGRGAVAGRGRRHGSRREGFVLPCGFRKSERDFIWRSDQRDPLAKEPSRISGQHADTPLRYANWLPTSQQDTVLVQSLPLC